MTKNLGPVVWEPINAKPGLKVNQAFNFSCIKVFFTANVLWRLALVKVKTEGQYILNTLTEKHVKKLQTEIKIHANPALS